MINWADFLLADTGLGKLTVTNYCVGVVKNGNYLFEHGTLLAGVSWECFEELGWLIEFILHVDSDVIIFGWTANLLCIFDF